MDSFEAPDLSVIVVVLGGGHELVRCLEALRAQTNPPPMEVIVPHDDRLREIDLPRQTSPAVKFLHLPGQHSYAELRAAGVRASRGRVVAVTEDQCIPPGTWCANVVCVHTNTHVAVGGPVEKLQPDSPLGWAIYLRELGTYMPPMPDGPSLHLTDCNVSYKRASLDSISGVWAKEFHEPQVHEALRQRGGTLWLSPALLTYQHRSLRFVPALKERYAFGRLFGCLRAAAVPRARRLLLVAVSLFLPALLVGRVLSSVLRKRRHRGACLVALPYLIVFSIVWSWGEFLGYLTNRPAGYRSSPPLRAASE